MRCFFSRPNPNQPKIKENSSSSVYNFEMKIAYLNIDDVFVSTDWPTMFKTGTLRKTTPAISIPKSNSNESTFYSTRNINIFLNIFKYLTRTISELFQSRIRTREQKWPWQTTRSRNSRARRSNRRPHRALTKCKWRTRRTQEACC